MKTKGLSFRKMKLATKISMILGIVLALILIALSAFSTITAKNAVTTAINGEFEGIAAQNGVMIQNIFDTAASTAAGVRWNYYDFDSISYHVQWRFSRLHHGGYQRDEL